MTRASVRVRPVELADVPELVRLATTHDLASGAFSGRGLADPSEEHLAGRFREIIESGERILIAAVDEAGSLVGLLVARPDDVGAIDLTPVLHISHMLVDPTHRRRGVGRQLLSAVVHLADERGIDHVVATAAAGSREGNRYLARLGFAPLVVHRIAPVNVLRRGLGLADAPERMAVLRRARLMRGARGVGPARSQRRVGQRVVRGA